ncbi:protein translocase subunit SecD [soil metagenome]
MARSTPVKKAWRSLIWLVVILAGLGAINWGSVLWSNGSWAPKLALDLQGGTQIILTPQVADGAAAPTAEQLDQAVSIIRQRIDAGGVSEAEITTQGGTKVVVSLPGTPDQDTINRIESSAKLEFRAVLASDAAPTSSVGDPTASPTPDYSGLESTPTAKPTDGSDDAYITPLLQQQFLDFSCDQVDAAGANVADPQQPLITCDDTNSYKYILGPVEVAGEAISDASADLIANSQGVSTGQWGVNIVFNGEGSKQFADVTTRLYGLEGVKNQFAIVLDGRIITAPTTNAVITNGKPQISGSFTQESAKTLADQLKFGALPIGFTVESTDVISATLGSSQLQSGLLAGVIGLILVFIYSLFQYRALGTVTIVSLVVASVLTYLVLVLMSWRWGQRLSLAGIAGLVVAIGFTADSFIVYFERIRDELRDGRALVAAVEAGWKRALRTVYAAKGVNLLSAIVLFIFAIGSVRGFALTLGVTVIIDVIVVVLFTHPMLQLLATTRFFSSGHPLSGLDPDALGAVYRGRAQFRTPVTAGRSTKEAVRRQTIAERKAAEAASSSGSNSGRSKGKRS